MQSQSIELEWQAFSKLIFKGVNVSEVQRVEMKMAFFAGYATCLAAVREISMPQVSEDEGVAFFESRHAESDSFCKKLIRTYAEGN